MGQDPGGGDKYHQLAHQGNDQAVNAPAHSLEQRGRHNAQSGEEETGADDPQGRDADFQQLFGGIENAQQPLGEGQEYHHAGGHDHQGNDAPGAEGGHHTVLVAGAVVKTQNRQQALVEAEYRHEHEGLQLEVQAEYRVSGGGEGGQDPIEGHGHHCADRLHHNGRHTDYVNILDDLEVGAEATEADVDIVIPESDHQGGYHHGQDLAGHSGDGGARHAHGREAQQAKDHDGVQNNVGEGADQLEDHGPDHVAGCLQGLFQGDLHKHAKRKHAADRNIGAAHPDDLRVCFKEFKEGGGKEPAIDGKQRPGANGQQNAVGCGGVCLFLPALAQTPGDQAGDAHRGAHGKGDEKVLQGEGQADGGQAFFTDLSHKIAVNNVVKCLHQHGKHGWQRHGEDQGQHGGGAHFVLSCLLCLHTIILSLFKKCTLL